MEDPTETATPSGDNAPSPSAAAPQDTLSRDDLLELVRAIQFAKPEISQTKIHKEITQQLAEKEGYGFLKHVKISDVKKAWKQLQKEQKEGPGKNSNNSQNADLLEKLQSQKQAPQLYTVGDQTNTLSSIAVLARDLRAVTLAAADEATKADREALDRDYVHIFLNIPLDQSGSRPHQALINFQSGVASSKNKKSKQLFDENGRMIVKIQRAAPMSDTDTTQHPMLLYNETKSHKTFVHPGEEYDRILKWIEEAGKEGALGRMGGSKAYFYARLTMTKGNVPDIISLDVTHLAPAQEW